MSAPIGQVYVSPAFSKTRNGGWPEAKLHRALKGQGGYHTACGKILAHADVYFEKPDLAPFEYCERCFR